MTIRDAAAAAAAAKPTVKIASHKLKKVAFKDDSTADRDSYATVDEDDNEWLELTADAPAPSTPLHESSDDTNDIMGFITGSPVHLRSPAELNPTACSKKKGLMSAKRVMLGPKSRGATKKVVENASALKKKNASVAKAKLMKWSQGVGSATGYMMSQGKKAPTNLSRDTTKLSKKQEKEFGRKHKKN